MTEPRALVILAEVREGPAIPIGQTLIDVSESIRRALENEGFYLGKIDVREAPPGLTAEMIARLMAQRSSQ